VALHQHIQRLLLIGARLDAPPPPAVAEPPQCLLPLIEALAPAHRDFDAIAMRYGHRYRSGFWAIYLLSAFAVLCAMMPLALGWDDLSSYMHSYAAAWVIAEIVVIATIGVIYLRGHRKDWQGEWLRARTVAELVSYLPLIAPLIRFGNADREASWCSRAEVLADHMATPDEVVRHCRDLESRAGALLATAWSDPEFVASYTRWAIGILQAQRHYHEGVARNSHALRHRIHHLTTALFALTALAAVLHLVIHTRWLSMVTTVFPALGAALHGAMAQSEAYRHEAASARVAVELQAAVERIRAAAAGAPPDARNATIQIAVRDALRLVLQEHQDWYMLIRPHHLALA
jgi:hypothetical protein